ncbi:hypothetical protein T10_8121 [Trichinella papuae]|uniref:Uncharacterized protein n=1 Tax=Trichinella papuae TaxID=268474 RepID=A0A0V1M0H2_9BILA|nr:hypothetical protein T10_8121 [Trichinella papuae]
MSVILRSRMSTLEFGTSSSDIHYAEPEMSGGIINYCRHYSNPKSINICYSVYTAGDSLPKRKGTEVAEYVVQIRSLEVHTGLRKMKLDLPNAKQQPALSLQFTSRRFHPRRESDVEISKNQIN